MKSKLLLLSMVPFFCMAQLNHDRIKYEPVKLKQYAPSAIFVFLSGASDGLRDASMYRMDGYSVFWNGKQSWLNKYKNRDKNAGPAYWGSTSFLAFTTDAPHMANMITHQFQGLSLAYMPQDNNRKFGHMFLKVLAYNVIRQAGHSLVYEAIFAPKRK